MAAALSRGVTVHRAHFTVDLVIALRFAKNGIRVCLRSLFCVCAARKQRPGGDENHKQTSEHFARFDPVGARINPVAFSKFQGLRLSDSNLASWISNWRRKGKAL
jgi:hypothetical protein